MADINPPSAPSSSKASHRLRKSIDTEINLGHWIYDFVVWIMSVIFDLFFREVRPRGAYKIPRQGPIIFVAGPHANQFIDPILLMRQVYNEAGRRISFLIAEASLKRKFVGLLSRATQSIGVVRTQDNTKPATGTIRIDFEKDPLLVLGTGTKFQSECMVRGLLVLPSSMGNSDIAEIISDTELILRKEFKGPKANAVLSKGTAFKVADHVDQSQVYHRVFDHLRDGGCIGVFPEGGSHDRTDFLPLKAGVAIMALGALAEYPDCNVKIVPCGMNYFHAHKFRSRAVIEFGAPVDIPPELVEDYKAGGEAKREAVRIVLEICRNALKTVTVTCPDFDTLMAIQAARRLYRPVGRKIPLPMVVELNRRLMEGYVQYKDDPSITHLRNAVADYNRQLTELGLKDHQVENATLSIHTVVGRLIYRSIKLLVLLVLSFPGIVLFSPIFVATKTISRKKASEALKASTVKIEARDVIATWKVLVAMGFAPLLYTFYGFLATYIAWKAEIFQSLRPLWLVTLASYIVLPSITYAALVIGETGMDIFKSLRPLALALNPTQKNTLLKLKNTRRDLVVEVTQLVNSLGPDLFPDFDKGVRKLTEYSELESPQPYLNVGRPSLHRRDSHISTVSNESNGVSRVGSDFNLANIPIFGYRRGSSTDLSSVSSNHSRSTSSSSDIEPEITSTSNDAFQTEVSRRIRGAMAEKRKKHEEEEEEED